MNLTFRATSPKDYGHLRAFLASAFQSHEDDPLLQRSPMHWKYWDPRPDWNGSRSWVLEREGQIVAHVSGLPLSVQSGGLTLHALSLIDWAASPAAHGFGTKLLAQVATLADGLIILGGSDITRASVAKLGFTPAGQFRIYARTLRPFHQAISHQRKGWRVLPRVARNLVRSLPGLKVPPGWRALLTGPEQVDCWPKSRSAAAYPSRDTRFYEYVLRCPTAQCRFFTVWQADRRQGYFCLSSVPGQARIAEMWMESDDPDVWAIGYTLAGREAKASVAAEIVGTSSSRVGAQALTTAGYQPSETLPIMVRASASVTMPELQMQMIDGDGFFLHHGKPEYLG